MTGFKKNKPQQEQKFIVSLFDFNWLLFAIIISAWGMFRGGNALHVQTCLIYM